MDFLQYLLEFTKIVLSMWWLWLAIILYFPAKEIYLWAIRELKFFIPEKFVLLEIKIPEEVEKTPKAMENVFHTIWSLYDPPANIRDYWIKGKWLLYYTLEIVGKRGEVHLYIRVPESRRNLVESAIYAEYPNAEIIETEDYVYKFGRELPNEEYDLWGADMALKKPEVYPIRTYEYWETERTPEGKRVDPLAAIFEAFSNLKEGEEAWIQIKICPITDDEHPYLEESQKLINQIMKRPEEKKPGILEPLYLSKIPSDIWQAIIHGKPVPERAKEKIEEKSPFFELGLMRLSPGEAEALRLIEQNLSKYVYEANIRFLYIAKRDIFSPSRGVPPICGAFSQFSTINLNGFAPDKTKTKTAPWFFEERRLFVKKRRIFRFYANRLWPFHRKPYILSTAELATLFHFPGKDVAPAIGVPRVAIRKAGAPPTLP